MKQDMLSNGKLKSNSANIHSWNIHAASFYRLATAGPILMEIYFYIDNLVKFITMVRKIDIDLFITQQLAHSEN